jgi:hypothetical protein
MNEGDLRISLHRLASTVPTSDPMPSLRRRRRDRRRSGGILTVAACVALAMVGHQVVSEKLGGDAAVAATPAELMPQRSGNLRLVDYSVVPDRSEAAVDFMLDAQSGVLRFATQCTRRPTTVKVTATIDGFAPQWLWMTCSMSYAATEWPIRELFGQPTTSPLVKLRVTLELSPLPGEQAIPAQGTFLAAGSYLPAR